MSPGGRIKDSDIEAVRERNDIVRLISEYVPLKKSGREYRGPCPFHKEKDPSFYVNAAKGVYYCFGCKASGGIFNFVMQVEGLSFSEAVERLADRIGYQVSYVAASPQDIDRRAARDRILKLNQTACEYYVYMLREAQEGKTARDYLESRGLGEGIVEEFHLGFAQPGWRNASEFFLKKGFSEDEIASAGLARIRSSGRGAGIYDIFRDRIIFPIIDHRGRVVAFGGRRMPDREGSDEPKYINSPETKIYRKGHVLYGLFQSREEIQDAGEAIVVEGYTDLLALFQAGIKNVVATLGTAMTENHFDLLGRFCEKVFLAFDADRAGTDAALRPLEFFNRFRAEVSVITLTKGEDPASLVERGGSEAFESLKADAEPLLDFAVRKAIERCDTSTTMGRRKAMEGCMPVLSKISSEDMRPVKNELVRKIGGWLDMPEQTVEVFLKEASAGRGRSPGRDSELRVPAMWQKVENEALRVLMHQPRALLDHQYLDSEYFVDEGNKKILEMLKEISLCDEEVLQADYDEIVGRLVESIEDGELRGKATRLLVERLPESGRGFEEKVFDRLSYVFYKRQKQRIELEIGRVNKQLEPKKYESLCDQLLELDQVMKEQFPYDHR